MSETSHLPTPGQLPSTETGVAVATADQPLDAAGQADTDPEFRRPMPRRPPSKRASAALIDACRADYQRGLAEEKRRARS